MKVFSSLSLFLLLIACQTSDMTPESSGSFDWQGHRGARGLVPENPVAAMLKALAYPQVKTLEMDVAVTGDGVIVLSHEPWCSAEICSLPDGNPVTEAEADTLRIYSMTFDQLQQIDCGKRGHPRFPEQQAQAAAKPSLEQVVTAVNQYCTAHQRPQPRYNIEIKSQPDYDGVYTPPVNEFVSMLIAEVNRLGIRDQSCLQSFDTRALEAIHRLDTSITTAYLIENLDAVPTNLERLSYLPPIYSPDYKLLTANAVAALHQLGMKVIPWTVNDSTTMKTLMEMGVDGIITDYPNRIPAAVN